MYNILIDFQVPMKLVPLIKMYLNETYNRVWLGKHLSDILMYVLCIFVEFHYICPTTAQYILTISVS